jgi:fatty acid desaturase
MLRAMQLVDLAPAAGARVETITDPRSAPEPLLARGAAFLLNDPRDVAMLGLMMESALVAGSGVYLFFSELPLLYVAPIYWALHAFWVLDRFTLMLHCTSHRPLFKSKYGYLNKLIPWVLGPFFGQTPNTYFAHHMAMHHREENLAEDLSATLGFKRDRFDHWLRYYVRFLLIGLPELAVYFWRRKQTKQLRRILAGEGVYWTAIGALAWFSPAATLVVFVIPLLAIRAVMMMGNWSQHSFVCPEQPDDPYRASITCINTRYNRRCFNDGYHVLHHVLPRCHWTEHPSEFEKNLGEYGRHDAIVFDGLDFFQVFWHLMLRRWHKLAAHFVQLPGAPVRTRDEIIELLQRRVRPVA